MEPERALWAGTGTVAGAGAAAMLCCHHFLMKQTVQPSAAITLAAILDAPVTFRDLRIGIVLLGGNVDLDILPWTE